MGSVNSILKNEQVSSAAAGLTLGLLASAADDAALGGVVSTLIDGGDPGTGVAVSAAVGASVFLMGAMQDKNAVPTGAHDKTVTDAKNKRENTVIETEAITIETPDRHENNQHQVVTISVDASADVP